MRPTVILAFFCLASLVLFASAANLLEVSKTVEAAPKAGVYTVTVGYRALGGPGRVFNLRLVDSLPEELDLVSGNLVTKLDDPTSDEWQYYSYLVKPRNVPLTISEPTAILELPPSEVSFTTGNSNTVTTAYTDPVTMVVEFPVPKGTHNLTLVVGFFTLAFPVLAAVYFVPSYRNSQLRKRK